MSDLFQNEDIIVTSVDKLLNANLIIPKYQRSYKWTVKNVNNLLLDIKEAIDNSEKFGNEFKYRIGTIILYENNNEYNHQQYEIVDGQQRIITLSLIKYVLEELNNNSNNENYINVNINNSILKNNYFFDETTRINLNINYKRIKDYFSLNNSIEFHKSFLESFEKILEAVVVKVDKISEAFQLFDSQNTRGKALYPHDLLKAYHLREMKDDRYQMILAVKKWEEKDDEEIKILLEEYLFPIWNWSKGFKTKTFSSNEIDVYKGINEKYNYTYAKRAVNAMPYFQIGEPFISGNDFFEMIHYYSILLEDVKKEIKENYNKIYDILENKEYCKSKGFKYAKNLFYCGVLHYYDKFNRFDNGAIKKIFTYAFMLRVDMENLSYESINKYAIGESNERYTNERPLFMIINNARLHSEITELDIIIDIKNKDKKKENWKMLHDSILEINGVKKNEQ